MQPIIILDQQIVAQGKKRISSAIWGLVRETTNPDSAILKKNFEGKLQELMKQQYADINYPATKGWTPMHAACKMNKIEIIKILLKYGATINTPPNDQNNNPIDLLGDIDKQKIIDYLQTEYSLECSVDRIHASLANQNMATSVEEFILTLLCNYNKEENNLKIIRNENNDVDSLKNMYGYEGNIAFTMFTVLSSVMNDNFIGIHRTGEIKIIEMLCVDRMSYYGEIFQIIENNDNSNLVDRLYEYMWLKSNLLQKKSENLVEVCNKDCYPPIFTIENTRFLFGDVCALLELGMQLLVPHVSRSLLNELQYTKICNVISRSTSSDGQERLELFIDTKAFFLREIDKRGQKIMDCMDVCREILDNGISDEVVDVRLLFSKLYSVVGGISNDYKSYIDKSGPVPSFKLCRDFFVCFTKWQEKLEVYLEMIPELQEFLQSRLKLIDDRVKNKQQDVTKCANVATTTTSPVMKIEDNNEFKKQQKNKIDAWKKRIEENKHVKKLSSAGIKLCSDIKQKANEYFAKYNRGVIINSVFSGRYVKCESDILNQLLDGRKKLYSIPEIQQLVCSLGGTCKLSSKNHLFYSIPDLYAEGEQVRYITDCIALPTKSNAKNDECIAECYVLKLKNNLTYAGFKQLLEPRNTLKYGF